jgi:hypothetical protein
MPGLTIVLIAIALLAVLALFATGIFGIVAVPILVVIGAVAAWYVMSSRAASEARAREAADAPEPADASAPTTGRFSRDGHAEPTGRPRKPASRDATSANQRVGQD